MTAEFEPVIGLEIHVELATRRKMFCGCPNTYGEEPNTVVCPVCMGHPGTLPVPNEEAVARAVQFGLALGAEIHLFSLFFRKNYFYPDLPKGYQITQYSASILTGGSLQGVRIERANLEEETAKSYHTETGDVLLDYNRAGIPLLEIVTHPDIRSPEQARAFLEELRLLLIYLGISECDMEKGQLRVDANISVRPVGSGSFGTKVEIKNLNSFRSVEHALRYEWERQAALISSGGTVEQETRLWDEFQKETRPMRSKEEAEDYRYFMEPDLPPLQLSRTWLEEQRAHLPELPEQRRKRYREVYHLSDKVLEALIADPAYGRYFEQLAEGLSRPELAGNWVAVHVLRVLKAEHLSMEDFPLSPDQLRPLLRMIEEERISHSAAQEVFEEMLRTGRDAASIVEERGLEQVSSDASLLPVVRAVLDAHPEIVEKYRRGKTGVLGVLIGAVMKETRGRANPQKVRELLMRELETS